MAKKDTAKTASKSTNDFRAVPTSKKMVPYQCGHKYAKTFAMDFFGEEYGLNKEIAKKREKCGDCRAAEARKVAIRCGLCGFSIMPGESVALYAKENADFHEGTQIIDDKHVIGCMRWNCCPSGAFLAGRWSDKGFVPLFPESGIAAAEALRTGQTIIVNNA